MLLPGQRGQRREPRERHLDPAASLLDASLEFGPGLMRLRELGTQRLVFFRQAAGDFEQLRGPLDQLVDFLIHRPMLGMQPYRVKLHHTVCRRLSVSIAPVKRFARFNSVILLLCALLLSAPAQAVRVEAVEVDLVASHDAAVPGGTIEVGLRIRHDPHWHTYWRFAGDSGLPTRLDLTLPAGWEAGEIAWPAPKRLNTGPLSNYGYEGEVILPVRIGVPKSGPPGVAVLRARAQWLMCREVCIPGEAELSLELPVRTSAAPSPHAGGFERSAASVSAGAVAAQAGFDRDRVSLSFRHPALGSAEFFPYREGLVRASAPQRLHATGAPGEGAADRLWRLELEVAEPGPQDARWIGAVGLLMLDGRGTEVVVAGGGPVSGGELVATATGEDAAPGPQPSRLLGAGGAPGAVADAGASGAASLTALAIAVVSGLVGGLLLNLMPCVFPVIGLKVLGFAGHAGRDPREARRGALAFGAGVLLSFWLLASVLLALQAAGETIGWGFQLQSPAFVAAIALLFVLMALNFAGTFEIGVGMTRVGNLDPMNDARGGALRAFGSGALAVLVATPCSAPFMGSALGYTLGRSATEVMAVFTAIAVGMAAPYVLLGWFPAALKWLPRPGRWMESFRQFLAFPMLATVAWLAWVLGQQSGVDAVLALGMGAVLVALGAWLYGRFVQTGVSSRRRVAAVLSLACLLSGGWLALSRAEPVVSASIPASAGTAGTGAWDVWSERRVAQAVAEGRTVFVDFTAAWCVSCQVNKKLVLEREPVVGEFGRRGVVLLRADWTNRDPAITRALAANGRSGVPLYLIHRPGNPTPILLPEILTPGIVLSALGAPG